MMKNNLLYLTRHTEALFYKFFYHKGHKVLTKGTQR